MDIPIQYPWYRRFFPHRHPDRSSADPLTEWPHIWPFSWSFPLISPSLMRWFNWPDNGHSEVFGTFQIKKKVPSCPTCGLACLCSSKHNYACGKGSLRHFSGCEAFLPDELSVSVSDDFITIHAKHEDRQDDHGFVSREFLRKYRLPAGVSGADVTSSLTSDGVLTITAPRSSPGPKRRIPISCEDEILEKKM